MITYVLIGIGLIAIMPYLLKLVETVFFFLYAIYIFISCKEIRQEIIKTIYLPNEQNLQSTAKAHAIDNTESIYDYSSFEFDDEAYEFIKSKAKQYGNAIKLQFELVRFYIDACVKTDDIENILARKYIFDWLDEEINSTQDTIRYFISSCGIPEIEYIGSKGKKLDKADDYLKEIQQCIKDISYVDENLNALFNVEIVKYLQQKYKIGYYLE
ncbi:MAG: hypothetical protein K6C33_04770 [Desulfovibrio sp.]|nr:hypothetical protein [Desulfovibrio sp.]